MTEIIAGVFIPDSAMACEGMHFMSSVCGRGRWSLVSCRTGGRLWCETWRKVTVSEMNRVGGHAIARPSAKPGGESK